MPTLTSTQTRSANDAPLYVPTDGSGGATVPGPLVVRGALSSTSLGVGAGAPSTVNLLPSGGAITMLGGGGTLTVGDNTDLGTTIALNGSVGARRLGVAGTSALAGSVTVGTPAINSDLTVNGNATVGAIAAPATFTTVGNIRAQGPAGNGVVTAEGGFFSPSGVSQVGSTAKATTVTTVTAITFPAGGSTIPLPGVPALINFGSCVKVTIFSSTNPNTNFGNTYNVWATTVRSAIGGVPIVQAVLLAGGGDSWVNVLNNPTPVSTGGLSFVLTTAGLASAVTATCIVEYTTSNVP